MKKAFALVTTLAVLAFVMAISSVILTLILSEKINYKVAKQDFEQNLKITQYGQNFVDNSLNEFISLYPDYNLLEENGITKLNNDDFTLILSFESVTSTLTIKNDNETKLYLTVIKTDGVLTSWKQN